jgi:hypothetical protein
MKFSVWTWKILGVPFSDLVRDIRKVSSDQVLNRIEHSISRFGGLLPFLFQTFVMTHLRIGAKESKKDIQGCSSNVGKSQSVSVPEIQIFAVRKLIKRSMEQFVSAAYKI